jgi:hypothetical protein
VILNLGARPNQQHNTHKQRKDTRHGCWQPKPVTPVSEIGQTASVGLSLMQAGETSQTNFVQKLPKDQNISRAFPHLNKRSHSATETSLLKKPSRQPTGRNRSDEFSPSNPQEKGPENTPRKPPRDGSESHHQEQLGTTQRSLKEPRRIFYT